MSLDFDFKSFAPSIFVDDGVVVTPSGAIAAAFGRDHATVKSDIRNFTRWAFSNIEQDYYVTSVKPNFKVTVCFDGKDNDVLVSKDCFMMVTAPYNSERDRCVKIAYINRFNIEELAIREQLHTKIAKSNKFRQLAVEKRYDISTLASAVGISPRELNYLLVEVGLLAIVDGQFTPTEKGYDLGADHHAIYNETRRLWSREMVWPLKILECLASAGLLPASALETELVKFLIE